MGTVGYVAPEQIKGEVVDGRADQYALGCLLFECLTGTLPFRHRSETGVIFAHLEEPAPRASERRDGLPAALDPVLARGLSKEPGDRFATCTELVTSAGPTPSASRHPPVAGAGRSSSQAPPLCPGGRLGGRRPGDRSVGVRGRRHRACGDAGPDRARRPDG